MIRRGWGIVLVLVVLLAGCGQKPKGGGRMVTRITVTCENADRQESQVYVDSQKMQKILNGLRTLGQRYKPHTDPEPLDAAGYRIVLEYADGSQRCYRIKGDRYIRLDSQPWQETESSPVQRLNELLQTLPGDPAM